LEKNNEFLEEELRNMDDKYSKLELLYTNEKSQFLTEKQNLLNTISDLNSINEENVKEISKKVKEVEKAQNKFLVNFVLSF